MNNTTKPKPVTEEKKQSVLEQLWLNYYNNTLLEKGVIDKESHRKMQVQISKRGMSR